MKILALIIMFIALFLLYRIAYPKRPATKKNDDTTCKKETDISEIVIKTRFVRPNIGQPQPTTTTPANADSQEEKPFIFAGGNEKKDVVITTEKLDEVFSNEPNPEDLDIEPDKEEEEIDADEEAEELRKTLGRDAEPAGGLSIEEMTEAAKAIDNPSDKNAGILFKVEKTDMFEKLVSGDEGKTARIKMIIDRHFRSQYPEVKNEENNSNEWKNFDIRKHLV